MAWGRGVPGVPPYRRDGPGAHRMVGVPSGCERGHRGPVAHSAAPHTGWCCSGVVARGTMGVVKGPKSEKLLRPPKPNLVQ